MGAQSGRRASKRTVIPWALSCYCCLLMLLIIMSAQPAAGRQLPELTTERVLELELGQEEDAEQQVMPEDTQGGQMSTPGGLLDSLFRRHGHSKEEEEENSSSTARDEKPRTRDPSTRRASQDGAGPLSPVILVPGYGGSRLEAKINKRQVKHYFCERSTGDQWRNIWIDLKLMLPYMIDCLIEDFRLEFEPRQNTTHNTEGVEIRVRDPQELATVEYLTDIHLASFGYFAAIIKRLTQVFGYTRNVNLRGAPYDFRKAPNELGGYFAQLKLTIERMYQQQQQQPITFVCHSMGCNNVLYFLQRQTPQWKQRHVLRVVSLAAPWGGSMQAVRATAFGDNLGLPYLFDEAELRIVQKSVPSTMYLYPSERAFRDEPLVRTHTHPDLELTSGNEISALEQTREAEATSSSSSSNKTIILLAKRSLAARPETYTARDFKQFFEHIRHPEGYLMWLNTKDLLRNLEPPGVEVSCLYGRGHSTLARMEFDGEFPESRERDVYADGDGTVAVQSSASVCHEWAREQKQPVSLKAFYANHVDMMKDPEVLNTVEEIIAQDRRRRRRPARPTAVK